VPVCEERLVQVEGLTPGTHSLHLALVPQGLPTALAEAESKVDAAQDAGTPNTPLAVELESWEDARRRSAAVSESVTFTLESPSPAKSEHVCRRISGASLEQSSAERRGHTSSQDNCAGPTRIFRYLNGDDIPGDSLGPLAERGAGVFAGNSAHDDGVTADRQCYRAVEALGGGGVAVVNLDRRPGRWKHVEEVLVAAGFSRDDFSRVSAADGRNLSSLDPELTWLFRRNHFNSDSSVIGCALSHLRIWMRMIECARQREAGNSSGAAAEWVLVLEDDVELREGFLPLMQARLNALSSAGRQWDFMCIGSRQSMDDLVDFDSSHELEGLMRIRNYRNCHTHAYALNVRGAALMLEKAAQEGIICGLDWFMAIHHRRLRSYGMMPSLAGQQSDLAQHTDIHGHSAHWGVGSQHAHLAEAGIL